MPNYYGPGSTGQTNPAQAPVQHGISNPPFFHSNRRYDHETDFQVTRRRLEQEAAQRGFRPLPDAWDVTLPGGAGVGGTGAYAQASPFLFPGNLPGQGVRLADGSVVNGNVNSQGQIFGTQTGGTGASQAPSTGGSGNFNYNPGAVGGTQLAGSATPGLIGQVNSGSPGGGGTGGSLDIGFGNIPSNPTQSQADAILNQQRDIAVDRLRSVDDIFSSRLGELTNQALARQIEGTDTPFDDSRLDQMQARLAAQAASADRGRRSQIRENFAGRGLGGSGLQLGAEQASMSQASAQRGANMNNLLIQQALENFQARERAQAGAQSWLSQQAAGIMPSILREADLRSRFEITGDGGADQDIANALTSQALGQLAGPDPATNPAAANTRLQFGPGANSSISTPGGPPISVTGGTRGGFTPGANLTPAGQGGGLQGSNTINSGQSGNSGNALQGQGYNPYTGAPSPLALPNAPGAPLADPYGGGNANPLTGVLNQWGLPAGTPLGGGQAYAGPLAPQAPQAPRLNTGGVGSAFGRR